MHDISRRSWLIAAACWADLLRGQEAPSRFVFFDPDTASEIEAIAEAILPSDTTPGARSAGVIRFIDRNLSEYEQDKQSLYRSGLVDLQIQRAKLYPESSTIAKLSAEQRNALLKSIEDTEFFKTVRVHTILGFFGHPKHGGNRDQAGFKLLQMETSMHFQPPFGYYDREAQK